jgi:hypothetical protein
MPRCKNCRNKFEPMHFNQKYCFEPECTRVWIDKVNRERLRTLKREHRKQESETLPRLQKKLKEVFHLYIRTRDKNRGCISCGKVLLGKYDAGHYWNSNNHAVIRYHPDNVHGQCVQCNQHLHGNLLEYQIHLKLKIGAERYQYLEDIRNQTKKWSREELKELIEHYEKKLKDFS